MYLNQETNYFIKIIYRAGDYDKKLGNHMENYIGSSMLKYIKKKSNRLYVN